MMPVELNLTGSLKNNVADMLLVGTSVAPAGGYMEAKVGAVVSAVALVEPDKTVKVPTELAAAKLLPTPSTSRPAGALMV